MICKNILITGVPGVGKTTLVRKLVNELEEHNPIGFYTQEIREKGIRKGFELISLKGQKAILSHVNIKSTHRVSKYGVNLPVLESFLNTLEFFTQESQLAIIDEIGKMECFSELFQKLTVELLDSEKLVLATIALYGKGFIEKVKQRKDILIFEVTHNNRNEIFAKILLAFRELNFDAKK